MKFDVRNSKYINEIKEALGENYEAFVKNANDSASDIDVSEIDNPLKYLDDSFEKDGISGVLLGAFPWGASPEGFVFWDDVDRKLKGYV